MDSSVIWVGQISAESPFKCRFEFGQDILISQMTIFDSSGYLLTYLETTFELYPKFANFNRLHYADTYLIIRF